MTEADVEQILAPVFEELGKLRSLVEQYKATMTRRDKTMYRMEQQLRSELDNLRKSRDALRERVKKLETS